jgi:hypothetical protein
MVSAGRARVQSLHLAYPHTPFATITNLAHLRNGVFIWINQRRFDLIGCNSLCNGSRMEYRLLHSQITLTRSFGCIR